MESIWDIVKNKRKAYYGSSKKVYRKCDLERIIKMVGDLRYLGELHTLCRLVPSNETFLRTKAIPHYNSTLKKMQEKYPDIKEFQWQKPIDKQQ